MEVTGARWLLPCLVLGLSCCAHSERRPNVKPASPSDEEIDVQIMLLENPIGGDPDQRERERSADWLVAHAERTYPRLLARVADGRFGVAVVQLLPRFARRESIPVLELLLTGPELIAWAAGQALAEHRDVTADAALQRALAADEPATRIAAADGLATRRDPAACPTDA